MNDPEELSYADVAILDTARAAESKASGAAQRILRQFIDTYGDRRIGRANRTYIACFSRLRDDPRQWTEYGAHGAGVCLGLRLLTSRHPAVPELTTGIMPVTYGDAKMHRELTAWHEDFLAALGGQDEEALALEALHNVAAGWALATKRERWKDEQECRMIFLVRDGRHVEPESYEMPNGTRKRYIEVQLTERPLMRLETFILGPNQAVADAREQATTFLAGLGYRKTKIISSKACLPLGVIGS